MPEEVTKETIEKQEQIAQQQVDDVASKAKQDAESKGLSPEEVRSTVEKARKEEKDKLYPQIEELKNNFKEIETILKEERAEKERIKKEAERKAELERQNKLTDQEKTNEVLERLEEQLKQEREEREKFKAQLEERDKRDELNRYRRSLIEANKDVIIAEMVHGTTKEELDESLQLAKTRFKELEEEFTERLSTTTRRNMPRSTNPDLEALEELEISKDLTAIDTDKYLQDPDYRKRIQSELANEYARLSGRG